MKVILVLLLISFVQSTVLEQIVLASNRDRQKPLYFDPQKNGVPLPKIYLDYDISRDYISIGQTRISSDTFMVFLGEPQNLDKKIVQLEGLSSDPILLVSFPKSLMTPDSIEMLNEKGEVHWQHHFEKSESELGALVQKALGSEFFSAPEELIVNVVKVDFEEMGLNQELKSSNIKFCLTQNNTQSVTKSCSVPFKFQKKNARLKTTGVLNNIKVNLNGTESKNTDSLLIDPTKEVSFFANSENQISFQFRSKPRPLFLNHFYQSTDEKMVTFIGHTNIPNDKNIKVTRPFNESGFLFEIGWLPTIGDLKKYWTMTIEKNNAKLFMTGEQGSEFTYRLDLQDVPSEDLQIKIIDSRPNGSYAGEVMVYGFTAKNTTVSAKQNKDTIAKKETGQFVWNFQNSEKGVINTKSLLLTSGSYTWIAEHSMFRGYSNEISFRLASIITSKLQMNLLAEFTFNHWFEDLLDWQNELLSVQRWGLSLKTFYPLKTFNFKDKTAEIVTLNLTTFDLKYRFTPGLWERDETWGLLFGYEKILLGKSSAPLIGAGLFWARSMPQIFDHLINYLPFMEYPKWVDMDFAFYPTSLTTMIKPKFNFNLNFHGKVLWKKDFFGEAGFGYQSFAFTDFKLRQKTSLQSIYGTVGLGVNF